MEVKIEQSWKQALESEFGKEYFKELTGFVKEEYKSGGIYPAPRNIFRAFELTPFNEVKVVILGQDPYHGAGQANGLSFAVNDGVSLPPSLQNMYKELADEYKIPYPKLVAKGGDLSRWASQGVLLLNATLTVRAKTAGSHQGKGWEAFTDAAVRALSEQRNHLVFMLWGRYAKEKGASIDWEKHLILESAHPSPFSAYNGFFGNNHFKLANDYLTEHSEKPIDWV
jgi:uracil-DNA glycosylase